MTPDLLDPSAAVVQASPWRWLPGMVDTHGRRVLDAWPEGRHRWSLRCGDGVTLTNALDGAGGAWRLLFTEPGETRPTLRPCEAPLPDLDDPATVGCLLALVQQAFNDDTIHPSPATYDRHDTAEPEIRWHVCRHHEGEDEWLRESGAFGAMVDGHRDPPIVGASAVVALVAALLAAPPVTPRQ